MSTPTPVRGYLRGSALAARYVGAGDRKTFRQWRDDPEIAHRELLQPRIIRGQPYYKISKLDQFMDPALNAPGATILDNTSNLPKPKKQHRHV